MTDTDNITRFQIAESIHNEFGLPKKDCIEFVSDIIDVIIEGLEYSNKVKIHNFGTFIVRNKKSRIGRNPITKEKKIISSRNVVLFKPSKEFKNLINLIYNEQKQ